MEVDEDILGLPSLIDRTISVDVKQHRTNEIINYAMVLEVSRIVRMVSVDVRQSIKPEHARFFFSSSVFFFFPLFSQSTRWLTLDVPCVHRPPGAKRKKCGWYSLDQL